MKRSEMIERLITMISWNSDKEIEEQADTILAGLERNGMMPPSCNTLHTDECRSCDGYKCSCSGIYLNKWEPEDDNN